MLSLLLVKKKRAKKRIYRGDKSSPHFGYNSTKNRKVVKLNIVSGFMHASLCINQKLTKLPVPLKSYSISLIVYGSVSNDFMLM